MYIVNHKHYSQFIYKVGSHFLNATMLFNFFSNWNRIRSPVLDDVLHIYSMQWHTFGTFKAIFKYTLVSNPSDLILNRTNLVLVNDLQKRSSDWLCMLRASPNKNVLTVCCWLLLFFFVCFFFVGRIHHYFVFFVFWSCIGN